MTHPPALLRPAVPADLDALVELHTRARTAYYRVRFLREAALAAGRVEAWERNERARAFYARHGWRPDGHRRPGPAGACYVRMRLDMAAA
ncbi:hypothetical protein [Streptomyces kronopolitis]|uniref:hypothetical protein n=1 Tax=Streptomyces kronopolitis TaxID=1612435 RepID=UPI0036A80C4A